VKGVRVEEEALSEVAEMRHEVCECVYACVRKKGERERERDAGKPP
jgi:hypothetical protein